MILGGGILSVDCDALETTLPERAQLKDRGERRVRDKHLRDVDFNPMHSLGVFPLQTQARS